MLLSEALVQFAELKGYERGGYTVQLVHPGKPKLEVTSGAVDGDAILDRRSNRTVEPHLKWFLGVLQSA